MLNLSIWEANSILRKPDHIIIGAGLTGLYTAYFLKKFFPKDDVLILERGSFSDGASTKNAGFACFGSVTELMNDVQVFGKELMLETLRMRYNGLILTRSIFNDEEIGYVQCGGIEVFETSQDWSTDVNDLNNDIFNTIGLEKTFEVRAGNPEALKGFGQHIVNQYEGSLDTGKFYSALLQKCYSKGVRILFGFEIKHIVGSQIVVNENYGELKAKRQVIVTTNAFANTLLDHKDILPARNQVFVTHPLPNINLRGTFHYDRGYVYFRQVQDRIMIGGFRNRLGDGENTTLFGWTAEGEQRAKDFLHDHISILDHLEFEYRWSGIIAIGSTKMPIIEKTAEGLIIGVRMGGMGVAICSEVGSRLAQLTAI